MATGPVDMTSDEAVIRAIANHHEPVANAADIYAELGYSSPDSLRPRLHRMVEAGMLHKKKSGPGIVFWPTTGAWALLADN